MPKGIHNSRRGPKTQFHPTFVTLVLEQCLLGQTDERIAEILHVGHNTLNRWKHEFPAFGRAFERGRDEADGKAAKALLKRALGFTNRTKKIVIDPDGAQTVTKYETYFPPDPGCLAFYLGNRKRAIWQTKPSTLIDAALGLEQLILAAVERREKREQKTIEHQPTDPKES